MLHFESLLFFGPSSTPEHILIILPLPPVLDKYSPPAIPQVQDNFAPTRQLQIYYCWLSSSSAPQPPYIGQQ